MPDGIEKTKVGSPAFASALPFVLCWEGGYVNHSADLGGPTNRGVTQTTYDTWRSGKGLPLRDVQLLEESETSAIYESGYWLPPHCDLLQKGLDLVQFDTAVNMGPKRAVRFLQQSAGCVVDGDFGPTTRQVVAACDPGAVMTRYCDIREAFYRRRAVDRPNQSVFLRGWLNRLGALRREVGVPGIYPRGPMDLGDTGYIARIPDFDKEPDVDHRDSR